MMTILLKRVRKFMEHRPIVANSALCLGLWLVGDGLAQVSEIHRNSSAVVGDAYANVYTDTDGADGPSFSQYAAGSDGDAHDHSAANDNIHNNGSFSSLVLSQYDWKRTARCASYGVMVSGPVLATWYPYLDRLCATYNVAKYGSWSTSIVKVAADEIVLDPPFIALFYGWMNAWEGGTMESFRHKLDREFWSSWITSLTYWPPVLLMSFRFLPVYAQAPVINMCCILWDGYLSHRNSEAKHQEIVEIGKGNLLPHAQQ
jgi:Mpv17 / PMP22 family